MPAPELSSQPKKKAPARRRGKAAANATQETLSNGETFSGAATAAKPRQRRAKVGQGVEDFNQLNDRESVLEAPEVYIDSITRDKNPFLVFMNNRISKISTDIPLGLSRLFIEIVANACDNATRCYMDGIDPGPIEITVGRNVVTVKNYGLPIPVIKNAEDKWIPEWVLTNMKTGSNFRKQRHGGGRNGMGATIVGFFSLWSKATVYDHLNHAAYNQEWRNSLQETTGPQVIPYYGTFSSTEISYQADLSRFGYPEQAYPELAYNLFARIAADASFTCKVPVIFNGVKMCYSSIVDYAKLFVPEFKNYALYYVWPQEAVTIPQADGSQMDASNLNVPDVEMIIIDTPGQGMQIGVCNSILTVDGGVHINTAVKYVSQVIKEAVNTKRKNNALVDKNTNTKTDAEKKKDAVEGRLTKKTIIGHVTIIINVRLPNPSWSGQTKTYLRGFVTDITTRQPGKFELNLPETLKKKILTWDLAKNMENFYKKHVEELIKKSKSDSRKRVVGKHAEDCEYARKLAFQQYVISCFFEGESAKAYARCVRTYMENGSKRLILISLGGKINNAIKTRDFSDLLTNDLFKEIINVLGLTWGMDYTIPGNIETLRCRMLMLMTDQDPDGLHIKMLVLSFFYKYFPSILKLGIVYDWRTKLISASRPGFKTIKFYYTKDYDKWLSSLPKDEIKKWTIKYFKGLGTTSEADAKLDVQEPWVVRLIWDDKASQFLELTMSGKNKMSIKEWMMSYDPSRNSDPIVDNTQYVTSFINDEFITFCLYTLGRHLPSFSDGLNDTRRKIIYYAYKHPKWNRLNNCTQKTLMSLDTFASYAKADTKYHHGDLSKVVANMTQRFVGHNIVPFFENEGQFGTRIEGGKDCASARYPKLIPNAEWLKAIYSKEDERILNYLKDEDESIEPETYYPVIPLVLITGWKGIAFGWSSWIPSHHPLEIIDSLVMLINGAKIEQLPELIPWYRGFTGSLEISDCRYTEDIPGVDWDMFDNDKDNDQVFGCADFEDKIGVTQLVNTIMNPSFLATPSVSQTLQGTACSSPGTVNTVLQGGVPLGNATPSVSQTLQGTACSSPGTVNTVLQSSVRSSKGTYSLVTKGIMVSDNPLKYVRITELPIGVWTQTYMENVLDKLVKDGLIKSYQPHNDIYKVDITVKEPMFKNPDGSLRPPTLQDLGLVRLYGLSNMIMLDENNRPIHYESAKEILWNYFKQRPRFYQLRKDKQLAEKQEELNKAQEKVKYIEACVNGDLEFKGNNKRARPREAILEDVKRLKLSVDTHIKIKASTLDEKGLNDAREQVNKIIEEGTRIYNTTTNEMWLADLEKVKQVYLKLYGDDRPNKQAFNFSSSQNGNWSSMNCEQYNAVF